jgi:fission process protein 1
MFQGLASLLLPAVTIHSVVDMAAKVMKRRGAGQFAMRWGPSGVGLLMIPLLPTILDEPVEWATERVFHSLWPLPKHKTD